ncbi:MAG: glutamate---cysteine ligase / carboxylate-amine ligase [Pseudonocardiales bacterium]|jgi:carboxylate-amine ligase|nr:glutamate---cysteine ligase / carboxylate-amine ligase [Pseudonocardiales bacterium]
MRQVGVEEELLLVDACDGHPVAAFEQVQAEAVRRKQTGPAHELKQEQAEIASLPSLDINELLLDLRRRRDEICAIAGMRGLGLAASATSPVGGITTTTVDERYTRMETRFGLLERMQLTCGMHVHVSIDSPAEGIVVLDRVRAWLPALLALSTNSPYFNGEDTGYASYRSIVWGQWPTSGPTELFGDAETYRALVNDLVRSGTILDEGMIYFDARLSRHYPTVEIRVADVCTDLADAGTIAALARGLVETAIADAAVGRPPPPIRSEVLRVAAWGAARFGLAADLLDPTERRARPAADLLDRLVDHVRPALTRSGDRALAEEGVARLLVDGTGADHQRAAFVRENSVAAVVLDVVKRTGG